MNPCGLRVRKGDTVHITHKRNFWRRTTANWATRQWLPDDKSTATVHLVWRTASHWPSDHGRCEAHHPWHGARGGWRMRGRDHRSPHPSPPGLRRPCSDDPSRHETRGVPENSWVAYRITVERIERPGSPGELSGQLGSFESWQIGGAAVGIAALAFVLWWSAGPARGGKSKGQKKGK